MSQQYQKECFVCHQQIYLSKPSPDYKGWIKTNLDGSNHVDPDAKRGSKYGVATTITTTSPTTPTMATTNSDYETKQAAINKAHDENIEASKNLTEAVNGLTSEIRILGDLVSRYLETRP